MRKLWLDFETRSMVDLGDHGHDRYFLDPTTEMLMLAWAFDDDEPKLWLPILGEPMPEELKAGLLDSHTQLMAWNYDFEKGILREKAKFNTHQGRWFDPSVLCAYLSLPIGLDRASKALKVDILGKMHLVGKANPKLMFSKPQKRTKTYLKKNPGADPVYFKDWTTHPEEWKIFCEYCLQDVRAERAVWYAATAFNSPMPESEIETWLLDNRMNKHGVYIDIDYVLNALNYAVAEANEILAEQKAITGLENPNSVTHQLKPWLKERGYPFDSCDKEHIEEALNGHIKLTPEAKKVLELKQKLGGSAYKKLQSILDRVSPDGYLRDQFIYHGAHTGRWAGRGVQLQNLFKANPEVSKVLDEITSSIRAGKLDIKATVDAYNLTEKGLKDPCEMFTVMDAVAGTIRSAFIASPGMTFAMCDLAQIESRVLAALAQCQAMIDAYASGKDLYCEFMTWLLGKEITKKDKAERAQGKVVILGCGFQMGVDRFIDYAAGFGIVLSQKQGKDAVFGFREKYSEIPKLWKKFNDAAVKAVKARICIYVNGVVFDGRNPEMFRIKLPSGRYLHYPRPFVSEEQTDWGEVREGVSYEGWDEKGCSIKRLYGGLITENVVQAVARDILVHGMHLAEKAGFVLTMTIHDELVAEVMKMGLLSYKKLEAAMTTVPDWAEGMGFVLAAEGDENDYYKK